MNFLEASDTGHWVVCDAENRILIDAKQGGREEVGWHWRRGRGECCIACLLSVCTTTFLTTIRLYFIYIHIPWHQIEGLIWKRCSNNWVAFLPIEWMKGETGGCVLDAVIIGSDGGSITRRDWRKQCKECTIEVKIIQCLTLWGPMDYIVHEILHSRILEWIAFPFSRDHPNPGIEPRSPTLQGDSLPAELQGKPNSVLSTDLVLLRGMVEAAGTNWTPPRP